MALASAILVLEVLAIVGFLAFSPPARAHEPTTPCARVARVTGTTIAACRAARIRHATTHAVNDLARRCRAETRMPADLCKAIASAIVRHDHPPAWATSRSLDELLRRESTWSTNAVNESSGACGAFQRLPCPWRKYGGTSSPLDDRVYASPLEQSTNGLRYIAGRYGTPAAALRFHDRIGWY